MTEFDLSKMALVKKITQFQEEKIQELEKVKQSGKKITPKIIKEVERKVQDKLDEEYKNKKYVWELHELHGLYHDLLYIEDTKRIDVVLATALSSKLEGIPIWLILVGASGDMKSVQLNALEGLNDIHYLHKITSKTLVNGYIDKEKHPDLAPKLKDKIVVIRDMASLLKLAPVEKGEVWGQLRDLYDGFAGTASGQGIDIKYEGLKVTLLAGSTPAIDGQILVHQDLGTRELIYRTKGNSNKKKVMERCMENEETESDITRQLRDATTKFLENRKIKRDIIQEEILEKIREIALYVSYMRATAEIDQYHYEVRNDVYPEEPTRIAKQLKRMYICLINLANDYPEDRAIEILWEIARSSAFPIRVKLFEFLKNNPDSEYTTSNVAKFLLIGKSTAARELSILWNLKIVERREEQTTYPDRFIYHWKINKSHKFVQFYTQIRP